MKNPDSFLIGVIFFFKYISDSYLANEWLREYKKKYVAAEVKKAMREKKRC